MKTTIRAQSTIDPIAEARKNKNFSLQSTSSRVTIRLAAEVYTKRKQQQWTQADLAKKICTTQRVISNIESGDVNIGIDLLKRLVDGLRFSNDDLGIIFESCFFISLMNNSENAVMAYASPHQQAKYSNNNFHSYESNQH